MIEPHENIGELQTVVDICYEFINDLMEMDRKQDGMAYILGIPEEKNELMCFDDVETLYELRWFIPSFWITKLKRLMHE